MQEAVAAHIFWSSLLHAHRQSVRPLESASSIPCGVGRLSLAGEPSSAALGSSEVLTEAIVESEIDLRA